MKFLLYTIISLLFTCGQVIGNDCGDLGFLTFSYKPKERKWSISSSRRIEEKFCIQKNENFKEANFKFEFLNKDKKIVTVEKGYFNLSWHHEEIPNEKNVAGRWAASEIPTIHIVKIPIQQDKLIHFYQIKEIQTGKIVGSGDITW